MQEDAPTGIRTSTLLVKMVRGGSLSAFLQANVLFRTCNQVTHGYQRPTGLGTVTWSAEVYALRLAIDGIPSAS